MRGTDGCDRAAAGDHGDGDCARDDARIESLSQRGRCARCPPAFSAGLATVARLSLTWRGINAPNQLRLLLAGHDFQDGQLVLEDVRVSDLAQAVGA